MESEAEINAAFAKFWELADRKSDIFDEDIVALVMDESVTAESEHYRLLSLSQRSETGERPHAKVAFAAGEPELHAESDGNGPVDASLKAIESKLADLARRCCSIRSMPSPRAAQNRRAR